MNSIYLVEIFEAPSSNAFSCFHLLLLSFNFIWRWENVQCLLLQCVKDAQTQTSDIFASLQVLFQLCKQKKMSQSSFKLKNWMVRLFFLCCLPLRHPCYFNTVLLILLFSGLGGLHLHWPHGIWLRRDVASQLSKRGGKKRKAKFINFCSNKIKRFLSYYRSKHFHTLFILTECVYQKIKVAPISHQPWHFRHPGRISRILNV